MLEKSSQKTTEILQLWSQEEECINCIALELSQEGPDKIEEIRDNQKENEEEEEEEEEEENEELDEEGRAKNKKHKGKMVATASKEQIYRVFVENLSAVEVPFGTIFDDGSQLAVVTMLRHFG